MKSLSLSLSLSTRRQSILSKVVVASMVLKKHKHCRSIKLVRYRPAVKAVKRASLVNWRHRLQLLNPGDGRSASAVFIRVRDNGRPCLWSVCGLSGLSPSTDRGTDQSAVSASVLRTDRINKRQSHLHQLTVSTGRRGTCIQPIAM